MLKKKNISINYDINYFINNPISIIYKKNNKEEKIYKFNNIKKGKKENTNGDYMFNDLFEANTVDNFDNDFGKLFDSDNKILDIFLQKSEEKSDEYKNHYLVYPFDSILDFKYKIQMLTGIEWFKLCLFWCDDTTNELISSYILLVNGLRYKINYNKIEYDAYLNKHKNNYLVKSLEEFETMGHIKNRKFYILNIDDFINRDLLLNNKNEVENMYYSFILKFFPQFTYNLFYNYIYIQDDFKNKYNNLYNINIDLLKKETLLINKYLKNNVYDIDKIYYKNIDIYFNDLSKLFIKLRNIFEIFHINEYGINFMFMKLGNETYKKKNKISMQSWNKIKEYKSQENLTYNHIIFYINNKYSNIPIFLRINETSHIKLSFAIDIQHNLDYDTAFKYLQEKINPILNKINKFKDLLLLNMNLDELKQDNINIILSKSIFISEYSNILFNNMDNYEQLYKELQSYSHIFLNLTKDLDENISFNLKKGITSYNRNYFNILHPNVNNYYSKFSYIKDIENWNNAYKGINIKIIKNQNILNIIYSAINEIDIPFVLFFIHSIITNIKFNKIKHTLTDKYTDKNIKKITKLKLVDPVMFSFKRSKNSKKKYSKMCQKPFHPLIYTENEYKFLDDKLKKEIIPYINATNNEKVYYNCNNKNAPYLGFITDEHPNNYCIPCCRVKEQSEKEHHKSCLKNFILDKGNNEKKNEDIENTNVKYILQNIEYNRYSFLPNNLNIFFNKYVKNKLNINSTFYLYGLNDINIIYNYIFDKDHKKLELLNKDDKYNSNNLYFQHKLKINIIILDKFANLHIDNVFDYDEYILLYEENENSYYPIIEYNTSKDSKLKKIYTKNDDLIQLFNEIVNKSRSDDESTHKLNIWSFNYIKKKYDIKKILVNNKNLIYGVIIQFSDNKSDVILYPVDYFYNDTNYSSFKIINNNTLKDITEVNVVKFLKKNNMLNECKAYLKDNDGNYFALKLQNKKIFYFNQNNHKTLDNIYTKHIKFPFYIISEKIIKNDIEYNIELLNYNIYYIYYKNLYKLILQEITYYFSTRLNIEKRNVLNKLFFTYIKNYNEFYKHIINTVDDDKDINKIVNLFNLLKNIQDLSKGQINELLQKIKFNFDEDEKNNYINDPSYKNINDLLDDICIFIPEADLSKIINKEILKNILLPCSLEESNYCKKNKLLVPKEEKNNIINLIINDLQNPIRKNIIFSTKMIIDDLYQFSILPHEEIIIT